MKRAVMFFAVLVLATTTAAAAPQPAGSSTSASAPPWPNTVRLVATGDVVYPDRDARTVHVKFDVVFVRAEAPDPSIPGAWYVPAPKSVVTQSMSSAPDQWCPIKPRAANVPIDAEQSFLNLDTRESGKSILVSSMLSAVKHPEFTIGIATCNGTVWEQMPLVFQTLTSTENVIGEDGTIAPLVAGAAFPTARARTVLREDARSPTRTIAWTLSPVAD